MKAQALHLHRQRHPRRPRKPRQSSNRRDVACNVSFVFWGRKNMTTGWMFRVLASWLSVFAMLSAIGAAQAVAGDFAVTHVSVINTRDGSILSDMTVIVAGGKIAAVQPTRKAKLNKSVKQIDATHKFLIPGLWDMHVHIAQDDKIQWTRTVVIPLLLANGVTGVRDMGGNIDLIKQLRAEIDAG